ncbi:MAG: hypothetical protein Q7S58_04585 [Candidatus Binatus sp.]|uniref:hypothetical protein n=1 Tax=Candidatus Binatus sp. TaxID=2811406 RepID=UPI00271C8C31|nr:hypothetical protein [Candidatus Binatus sp.]MDO8431670.1 hypothetical protein [Candidatus Binatus sp.]
MKHAGPTALGSLEPIIAEIRKLAGLKEKKRGTFYRGSVGFLHFHEDPAGFFADLKVGVEFERMPVNNRREIDEFIRQVRRAAAIPSS